MYYPKPEKLDNPTPPFKNPACFLLNGKFNPRFGSYVENVLLICYGLPQLNNSTFVHLECLLNKCKA